jgi:hypothetical protein
MKRFLAMQTVALLVLAMDSMAAKVDYEHPNITIVAVEESLDSVLTAVGKEMKITVSVPMGINPVVNCDIQDESVKKAFKQLLGDLSYSLEWSEGGERLAGLTVLADGDASSVTAARGNNSHSSSVRQPAPAPVTRQPAAQTDTLADDRSQHTSDADRDAYMVEHEARMTEERAQREAEMAEEREAHEAEMAVRRQEEEIVHEERMREEVARKEAESAALFELEAARRP